MRVQASPLLSSFSNSVRCTVLGRREQPLICIFAGENGFPVLEEGLDALVPIARHGGALRPRELHAGFPVHFVAVLHDGAGEHVCSRALHDASQRYQGEYERDKGEVRHVHVSRVLAILTLVPPLPVFPGSVVSRVVTRWPVSLLWRPCVWRMVRMMRRALVVAGPSVAPRIVCSPLCVVGEDGVGGDEEAVPLEAHGVRQVGDRRRWAASVGVVQLYERVEAVFRVGLAAAAAEDLVGRRRPVGMDWGGPAEVWLIAMRRRRGMLGVAARLRLVRRLEV